MKLLSTLLPHQLLLLTLLQAQPLLLQAQRLTLLLQPRLLHRQPTLLLPLPLLLLTLPLHLLLPLLLRPLAMLLPLPRQLLRTLRKLLPLPLPLRSNCWGNIAASRWLQCRALQHEKTDLMVGFFSHMGSASIAPDYSSRLLEYMSASCRRPGGADRQPRKPRVEQVDATVRLFDGDGVAHDLSAFHYELQACQCGDVLDWIFLDSDDISELASRDATDPIAPA